MYIYTYVCVCMHVMPVYINIKHTYQSWKDCVWILKHLTRFYWICCLFLTAWPISPGLGCFHLRQSKF